MNFKKLVVLILSLLLAVLMMFGCAGNNNSDGNGNDGDDTSISDVTGSDGDGDTDADIGDNGDADGDIVDDEIGGDNVGNDGNDDNEGSEGDGDSDADIQTKALGAKAKNIVDKLFTAADVSVPDDATVITDKITISSAGNYVVRTAISGKKITVDCEGVTLYLDGATLSNEKKVIESNYDLTITLFGNNTVSNSDDTDPKNAIDCAGVLIINGTGSLSVTSTKNGIKATSVAIVGAEVNVNSAKDGICAENEAYDEAVALPVPSYDDGGYVYIDGAKLNVDSQSDGIQADTFVYIEGDSVIDVTAVGKGIKAGAIDWGADGEDIEWSDYLVVITGGEIAIDAVDDAVHSDGDVIISGGSITYTTQGKAVNADGNEIVTDGIMKEA